jgi:outer membrane lipoprotein-sorting protein
MNKDNIEEILKNIGAEEIPADVHKIAQETSNNFTSSLQQTRQPKRLILLEHIMKSRITKLAAAAVIFVAVIAGLPLLDSKQGVALADVLAKIEQARAYMYKMKMTTTGNLTTGMPSEQEIIVTVSNDYGTRWDTDMTVPDNGETMNQQTYVIPDQKTVVSLMPKTKQFMRMELDDDWLSRMKKQNNDPREVIKQIMNCEYTELGESVIDGVEVEGFQTTDPAYFSGAVEEGTFTLWVDAETWLPVRSEEDFKMGEQTSVHGVTYDYQWDIPVNASEFEPVIPDDFTAFATDGIKMPGMSEQAAIEGLKLFAEMAGRYPEKITLVELGQEIAALSQDMDNMKFLTDKLEKLREELSQTEMTEEEIRSAVMKKSFEIMQPIASPGWFHTMLVTDKKEPAYYGQTVTPDDTDAVLMRWKISDNEYRVIFGDLSVGNVTAEELANLEQQ